MSPSAEQRTWRRWLYPLLLVALPALFLFPYVFLGRSMLPLELIPVFQPWHAHSRELFPHVDPVWNPLLDSLQQYYPRRVYVQEALRGGWLPLWNPNVYGGSPFHGTQQGAVLYPPAWLLSLLPAELQFGWSALLHLALAAGGTFLFLRQMRLYAWAATIGAIAFAFNGYVVVWLAYPNVTQWTLCWLPLALYCWERGRKDLRWMAGCATALALSVLGGHGQSSEYVLLTWGAWALFRTLGRPGWPRLLLSWVAIPGVLAVLLSLGHLLPTLDYVPRTDRGTRIPWDQAAAAGMPLSQLWTFLLPRLFGDSTSAFAQAPPWMPLGGKASLSFIERSFYPGISVLVLAAAAWAGGRGPEHRRLAWFSLALAVTSVLLAMGTPLYWPFWAAVPGFGNFTAIARVLCVAGWGLACLAALGAQALLCCGPDDRRRAWRASGIAATVAGLLCLTGYFLFPPPLALDETLARMGRDSADSLVRHDLLFALGVLLGIGVVVPAARSWPRLRPVLAFALLGFLVFADLWSFGGRFNPASDPALIRARAPEIDYLATRPEPARMLSIGPGGDATDVRQRMPSNLPSVYGLADQLGSDSFVSKRYREWESVLRESSGGIGWGRPGAPNLRSAGVRYYLTGAKEEFPGLQAVQGPGLQEDPRALPYARVHTAARAMDSNEAVLQALAQPERAIHVALTTGTGAPTYEGAPRVFRYSITRRNGNRLLLEGEAPQPGLLVVCEQFEPGWRARVDGLTARFFPADHLLLGIPVTAGPHRVELTYEPDVFRVGLFGTLAGLALLCGLFAAGRRCPGSR